MMASSQFQFMRALDWRGLAQALAAWIARLAGLDVLPPGCRPIPVGNQDFDRQIAARLNISCAVAYAMILKWVKSNATNGRNRYYHDGRWWTSGTHKQFAEYTGCMSDSTWARAVRDLLEAGLIVQRRTGKVMAYAPVDLQNDDNARHFDGDARQSESNPRHFARPNKEETEQTDSTPPMNTPAAPARAKAAAAGLTAPSREGIDLADKDGPDELLNAGRPPGWPPIQPPAPAEFAPPPVAPPPSPDDVPTEPDAGAETESDDIGEETREVLAIFGGATVAEARGYARRWGVAAIRATHAEVTRLPNVRNPVGLTLHRLKHGGGRSAPPRADYVGGRYADFIEH